MTAKPRKLGDQHLFNYAVMLERVIDGDTIVVNIDLGFDIHETDQSVRLAHINCPELPTDEGQKAKDFTTSWLKHAKREGWSLILQVTRYDAREKYGRVLAYIFRGDDPVSLNDQLLQAGMATILK